MAAMTDADDQQAGEPEDVSEEDLAHADATISDEDLADADATISDEDLAHADAAIQSDAEEPGLPGEALVVGSAGVLVKRLSVLVLIAAVALGVGELRKAWLASRLPAALDQWQTTLEQAGLPLPGVPKVSIKQPGAVADVLIAAFPEGATLDRLLALEAWSALLEHKTPRGDMPPKSGLGAAMWICAGLGEPRPDVPTLRGLLPVTPGLLRETLSAACDLAAGQYRRAAQKAAALLGDPSPGCRPGLVFVQGEANRLWIAEVLDQQSPSRVSFRELLDDVQGGGVPRGLLREALVSRGPALVGLLTQGNPEVERGELLARLLVEAFPEGFPAGSPLEAVWPDLRAALSSLVGDRLARWEQDPAPALAIVVSASRIEPTGDLAPQSQFVGWRATLNQVVDDPKRLLRFTQRFLELGWLPPGMQDLLATHFVARGQTALADDTPGAILASGLVRLGEIAAGSPEEAGRRAESLLAKQAPLESLLGSRSDPAAQRIRARFARFCGVGLLGAGDWERAAKWLQRASELGYEPRFRLLGDLARVEQAREQAGPQALELARERVKALEKHAAIARATTDPAGVVAFELLGYPLQPALLDPLRCEAHLDLAEVLLGAGKADEAGTVCARATRLDSRNPRNLLVQARVFQSQGRKNEARKAVFKGLQSIREETIRKQFRALLQELGPN